MKSIPDSNIQSWEGALRQDQRKLLGEIERKEPTIRSAALGAQLDGTGRGTYEANKLEIWAATFATSCWTTDRNRLTLSAGALAVTEPTTMPPAPK